MPALQHNSEYDYWTSGPDILLVDPGHHMSVHLNIHSVDYTHFDDCIHSVAHIHSAVSNCSAGHIHSVVDCTHYSCSYQIHSLYCYYYHSKTWMIQNDGTLECWNSENVHGSKQIHCYVWYSGLTKSSHSPCYGYSSGSDLKTIQYYHIMHNTEVAQKSSH